MNIQRQYRKFLHFLLSGNSATIDDIRLAPPPSPLAPVDLSDPREVHAVMDLAARIGDILLSSGTGNTDVKTHVLAITRAYGLHYCHVDITLNTIMIFARMGNGQNPATTFRVVHSLQTDFSKLSEIDRLIRSIVAGATPLPQARKILYDIEIAPPPYRARYALLAWGFFAGAVGLLLGGGWLVATIATITTIVIVFANAWFARKSLPLFFQNLIGGFIAVVPAALTFNLSQFFNYLLPPSFIIASCIVALLAGLTLVQALQDGVTGAPVTASARFFETLLQTGGIIAGISIGIQFMAAINMDLPPLSAVNTTAGFAGLTIKVLSGVAASAFFCIASYCEKRALWVASATTLAASFTFHAILLPLGVSTITATAGAAVLIGITGGLLSRRYLIPPQITSISGIMPLLPGMAMYRGLYSVLDGKFLMGISNLATALATATALAAGVVLGEWIARRLRRPRVTVRYQQLRRPQFRRRPTPSTPGQAQQGAIPSTEQRTRRTPLLWRIQRRTESQWLPDYRPPQPIIDPASQAQHYVLATDPPEEELTDLDNSQSDSLTTVPKDADEPQKQ